MKKTVDFEQTMINEVMSLAWTLKLYDFGPTLRLIVEKGLEHKEEILKEAVEVRS
jgi:hypothetical protein